MKLRHVSVALLASLSSVVAQGMEGLPACARDCATNSIPKSCKAIDVNCICSDKSFITGISCCVANACSLQDQQAALTFAQQICGGAGVTDLPQSASCTSGSTETASGTSATDATEPTSSTSATPTSTGGPTAANATQTSADTQSVKTQEATATNKNAASTSTASGAAGRLSKGKDIGFAAVIETALFALLA
ncbi:putative CFEM domain protein [Aspergillus ellipticus CBS 707.79]|uniref:Putative CFEM domain protein n=1 Tax=Aspergillus ellipticus CBS 707.79 TaxID=1448320 RepID=A0A319DAL2_9EURO|nr:putative CFEM domain protein [Aspergillus ellipticus CBS 707.79]